MRHISQGREIAATHAPCFQVGPSDPSPGSPVGFPSGLDRRRLRPRRSRRDRRHGGESGGVGGGPRPLAVATSLPSTPFPLSAAAPADPAPAAAGPPPVLDPAHPAAGPGLSLRARSGAGGVGPGRLPWAGGLGRPV